MMIAALPFDGCLHYQSAENWQGLAWIGVYCQRLVGGVVALVLVVFTLT
jgi:hypothetical protein